MKQIGINDPHSSINQPKFRQFDNITSELSTKQPCKEPLPKSRKRDCQLHHADDLKCLWPIRSVTRFQADVENLPAGYQLMPPNVGSQMDHHVQLNEISTNRLHMVNTWCGTKPKNELCQEHRPALSSVQCACHPWWTGSNFKLILGLRQT